MRGAEAVAVGQSELIEALEDPAPSVRIAAAQCLAQYGPEAVLEQSLAILLDLADMNKHGFYIALQSLNALDELDGKAASVKEQIAALPQKDESLGWKFGYYLSNLVKKTLSDLE